jgi:hypothetical protein
MTIYCTASNDQLRIRKAPGPYSEKDFLSRGLTDSTLRDAKLHFFRAIAEGYCPIMFSIIYDMAPPLAYSESSDDARVRGVFR